MWMTHTQSLFFTVIFQRAQPFKWNHVQFVRCWSAFTTKYKNRATMVQAFCRCRCPNANAVKVTHWLGYDNKGHWIKDLKVKRFFLPDAFARVNDHAEVALLATDQCGAKESTFQFSREMLQWKSTRFATRLTTERKEVQVVTREALVMLRPPAKMCWAWLKTMGHTVV